MQVVLPLFHEAMVKRPILQHIFSHLPASQVHFVIVQIFNKVAYSANVYGYSTLRVNLLNLLADI